MSMSRTVFLALGLAALSAVLVRAAEAKFNVKPGLWEVTTTGTTTGAPPIPAATLAQMSPEQRARIEAAIKAAMARSGAPHVFETCVTPKQLEEGPDFTDPDQKSCKQTVVRRSSTVMEVHVECTGEQRMSGNVRFQAISSEAVKGSTVMTVSNGGNTMTANRDIQGKWLGAGCGSVKPAGRE
jgi:Protein of unknown function (DUF3617)